MEPKENVEDITGKLKDNSKSRADREQIKPGLQKEYLDKRREELSLKRLPNQQSVKERTKGFFASIKRRLVKNTQDTVWEQFVEERETELLQEQAEEILKQAIATLSKPIGELNARAQEKKAEGDKHDALSKKAYEESGVINRSAETLALHLRSFRKNMTVTRVAELLQNPTADTFLKEKESTIRALGVQSCTDSWASNKKKIEDRQRKERNESLKIRKAQKAEDKKYWDRVMRITSGKEPMPPEFARTHNRLTIPSNVLVIALKNLDKQKKIKEESRNRRLKAVGVST